ncbi:hypothetical protein QEN19_001315 [Hanseniaspora menglaensis]
MKLTILLTAAVTFSNIISSLPINQSDSLLKRDLQNDSDEIEYVTEYITETFTAQPTKVVTVLSTAVVTTSVTIMPTATFAAKMI